MTNPFAKLIFPKPFAAMTSAELLEAHRLQEQMVLTSETPEQYAAAKMVLQEIEEERENRAQEWHSGAWIERSLERMQYPEEK